MEPIRYIVLNGPAGVGKSMIAIELVRALRHEIGDPDAVVSEEFCSPLKHFIAAALSEKYQRMDKDRARPELLGNNVRGALTMLVRDHLRPTYGDDVLGKWLLHRTLKYPGKRPQFVVIDDGKWPVEIEVLPNRFVVRVERPGVTFEDLGAYVDKHDHRVANNGHIADTWMQVGEIVRCLVKR